VIVIRLLAQPCAGGLFFATLSAMWLLINLVRRYYEHLFAKVGNMLIDCLKYQRYIHIHIERT
jgi:hypothetical protein